MKEYLLKLSDLKRDAPYCRFRWICFPANDGDGYDIRNFTKKEKSR